MQTLKRPIVSSKVAEYSIALWVMGQHVLTHDPYDPSAFGDPFDPSSTLPYTQRLKTSAIRRKRIRHRNISGTAGQNVDENVI
jgi:hypothetical protein